MIIREFQSKDFPRLLVLAEQMRQESPNFQTLQMSNVKLVELGELIIKRPDLMCGLVAIEPYSKPDGSGIIGFFIGGASEYWFGPQKIATDLGLFITPDKRGGKAAIALIKGYEKWANAHNCTEMSLGITTGVHMDRTLRLYERLGFHQVGVVCKKRKGD